MKELIIGLVLTYLFVMDIRFSEEFKNRTKQFAIAVIKFSQTLPKSEEFRVIKYQLIKAATSVAANYRAVCRARSDAEFYSKISIVVEEADECVFWLELIQEIISHQSTELTALLKEANEIPAIVARSRKTVKSRLNH